MTPIYSATQIPKLYSLACEAMSLTMADFVERSAIGFCNLFRCYYGEGKELHIFAGPDLNGAIALAVARHLHERDYRVQCYLFYQKGQISELCGEQLRQANMVSVPILEVRSQFAPPELKPKALVVDGLFGCELVKTLEGGFAGLVKWLNSQKAEIVSIDLPSGLFADDNALNNKDCIIQAKRTISFEHPKLVFFLSEQYRYVGTWHIAHLGMPREVHSQFKTQYHSSDERSLSQIMLKRQPFSSMADYGRMLFIGEVGVARGLLALQARAAYLLGVGRVSVACPQENEPILNQLCPEACLSTEGDTAYRIPADVRSYSSLLVYLGEGAKTLTADELRNLLSSYRKPMVLEGEVLRLFAEYPNLLELVHENSVFVMSYEDCSMLLKPKHGDLAYIYAAQTFASRYRVTLILRGTYTAIVRSSGNTYFNTTGNASMAKFGINALLAPMIAGLLARGYNSLGACLLATYIWGASADLYVARCSTESLTPTALLGELPSTLAQLG